MMSLLSIHTAHHPNASPLRRRRIGIAITTILFAGTLAWWYFDRDTAPVLPPVPPSLSMLAFEHLRAESRLSLNAPIGFRTGPGEAPAVGRGSAP